MPEELWMEVHSIVQEVMIKIIPKKKKCKKQNGCLRRSYKQLIKEEKQMERIKGMIYLSEYKFPKNSKEK